MSEVICATKTAISVSFKILLVVFSAKLDRDERDCHQTPLERFGLVASTDSSRNFIRHIGREGL